MLSISPMCLPSSRTRSLIEDPEMPPPESACLATLISARGISPLSLFDAGCYRALRDRALSIPQVRVIISITNWISMRNTRAKGQVPNSPANPLPTAFYGPEIPLSADSRNRVQVTELQYVFDDEERILEAEKAFFPLPAGEWRPSQPSPGSAARRRSVRLLRRLHQHVDAAGGDSELAPSLVVDRHAVLDALGAGQPLGVAGDQHRLAGVLRRRGGDVGCHRRDLVLQPGAIDELRRVDDDRQHAVRRRAAALPLRPHRAAAAQGTRQHLADKGERVALVLAKGRERAARLAVHRSGVGRRLALAVEQDAGLQLLALVAGDPHLAHRDDTRGHVEDDRAFELGARYRDADGIGAEARIGTAPRCDGRPRIGHVDEMERDEARFGAHLAIGADPADVVRVAQGDDRDPGVARLLDADDRRLACGDLAPGALAVIDDQGSVLADHTSLAVGEDGAVCKMLQIVRDQADAVAVMAAQIGADQMIGNDPCFFRLTAGRAEDAGGDSVQRGVIDQDHFRYPLFNFHAPRRRCAADGQDRRRGSSPRV